MRINHFLLTRFNVKFLDKADVNNVDWLKKRYELFEKYSFQCIMSQTNKAFKWIVLFDINLPDIFKQHNAKLEQSNEIFKPVYIEEYNHELINKIIISLIEYPESPILTTRFDSDDVISENFLKKLIEKVISKNYSRGFYNQLNGYCYDVNEQKIYKLSRYLSNPFISKLDDLQSFNNILFYKHDEIKYQNNIINYKSKAQYLIIIHGGNYKNEPMGIPVLNIERGVFPHIDFDIKPYQWHQFLIKKIKAYSLFFKKLLKELKLRLS